MQLFATKSRRWGLVLAAGDGTRLRSLTTQGGVAVPKQFCSLSGGPSLLQGAIRRSLAHAPLDRTMVIVASEHRRWWHGELGCVPAANVVVQPANRGTAPGVLLPLLSILERDPGATVALFPSDHFVADEQTMSRAVGRAFEQVDLHPGKIVLLGIAPDASEPDYGWILPRDHSQANGTAEVEAFVEKPAADLAEDLLQRGGVWNSFLLVARGATLLDLYAERLPGLLATMREATWGEEPLEGIYARLSVSDFSRELLQGSEDRLRLLRVPACGWTDLGTPARVAGCVRQMEEARALRPLQRILGSSAALDLAGVLAARPAMPMTAGAHSP
jgi:mannose-1-phosphate guanylyltransferase